MKKTSPQPTTIQAWLDCATEKLPNHIAAPIRTEITAHYQDAFSSYRTAGQCEDEAERLALADLGDVSLTTKALQKAHITRRRCWTAMLACLLYPAPILAAPVLVRFLDVYQLNLAMIVSTAMVILYVIYSFKAMAGPSSKALTRPVTLLAGSEALWARICVVNYLLFQRLPLLSPDEMIAWDFSSLIATMLEIGFLAAEILSGVGALWLGWSLFARTRLALRLAHWVAALLLLVGAISLSGGLAVIFNLPDWAYFSSILGYVAVTLTLGVMAYLFMTSALRGYPTPGNTQTGRVSSL